MEWKYARVEEWSVRERWKIIMYEVWDMGTCCEVEGCRDGEGERER